LAEPVELLPRAPRSRLGFALKLLAALALLAVLAQRAGWQVILQRAAAAEPLPLAGAVAALGVAILLAAARWRRLLRQNAVAIRGSWAICATFTSLFVGQFLPSTVGSDGTKLWLLWRAGLPLRPGFASIVLDRLAAMVGMLALILASLPDLVGLAAPAMVQAATAAGLAFAAALALFVFVGARLPRHRRSGRIAALLHTLADIRSSLWSRAALFAAVLSMAIHLLSVVAIVLIAHAFGLAPGFGHMIGIVAIAILLSAIPLSVNGWGVREGAMVAGLSLIGISSADALLISVLFGLSAIAATLPGAWFWLVGSWVRRT
jgi:uncharacterized membrane protein YbhN (UPF0104 family)